jgi:hypothetical protein
MREQRSGEGVDMPVGAVVVRWKTVAIKGLTTTQ